MTQQEITAGLRKIGLKKGDHVLLHSSLASLGQVAGGAAAVVQAFRTVLGPAGTLLVPTFGGDSLGLITKVVREDPQAVHSIHPLASVAALGGAAASLCREHWKAELAHGADTPYTRLADLDGYVCLLGVDQDRNTTLHTVEELLRLPYLKTTPHRTFATPAGDVTKAWPFFPGPHRDFIGLDRLLRESGKMTIGRIGNAVVRLIRSRDLIELGLKAGRDNPAFVLCANPHCADCVSQRADLLRDRFRREPFVLAAAASLAGRYPDEIADHCQAAGIGAIELDGLRGLPLPLCQPDKIIAAVNSLKAQGLVVTALRLPGIPPPPLLKTLCVAAREAGLRRLVAPLTAAAGAVAESATAEQLDVSFFNVAAAGAVVSGQLLGLQEKGLSPRMTFNAANFAAAGEKPFLVSYKTKLRRLVDQLDVDDGLFDGTPQPLAEGNAEIKEMISILRAANFSGFFVLGARNRVSGSLIAAVHRFARLLETI